MSQLVQLVRPATVWAVAEIRLSDPARRNALGSAMFDGLEGALSELETDPQAGPLLLCGEGPAFCAGFDLASAADDPSLMRSFIHRLSGVLLRLRRLPAPVVAAVQGAALAGGCALLAASDFVVAAPDASLGYPVHRIGVSPAVTAPLVAAATGAGAARALLLSGELVDGRAAHRLGLVSHLAESAATVQDQARALARRLAEKPPRALRATKRWLNDIDRTAGSELHRAAADASAAIAEGDEALHMLQEFWTSQRRKRS